MLKCESAARVERYDSATAFFQSNKQQDYLIDVILSH